MFVRSHRKMDFDWKFGKYGWISEHFPALNTYKLMTLPQDKKLKVMMVIGRAVLSIKEAENNRNFDDELVRFYKIISASVLRYSSWSRMSERCISKPADIKLDLLRAKSFLDSYLRDNLGRAPTTFERHLMYSLFGKLVSIEETKTVGERLVRMLRVVRRYIDFPKIMEESFPCCTDSTEEFSKALRKSRMMPVKP